MHYINISCTGYVDDFDKCYNSEDCIDNVYYLLQIDKNVYNYTDLAVNFLIGDNGDIYEGRGWDHKPEKYKDNIRIRLIGYPDCKEQISRNIVTALKLLIEDGVRKGKLSENPKMFWSDGTKDGIEDGTPVRKNWEIEQYL